ncbi:MAG: hypothetical protein Q8Q73_19035 [Stagnimonas sp.]|nr:hypothetical protein [Stagnimonas sp.]
MLLAALLLAASSAGADSPEPVGGAAQAVPPTAAVVDYYTRPLIKARLRIPDSLRDYRVTAITRSTDDPSRFEVEVHFLARTPFGGTTAHSARFQMKRAATDGEWIVTAK